MNDQEILENDYAEFWPKGRHSKEWFAAVTKDLVAEFLTTDAPLPLPEINKKLEKLGKFIRNLPPEVRRVIHDREIEIWDDGRPDGTLFDDAFQEQVHTITSGGSALDILAKATGKKYQRNKQKNADLKRKLLTKAAMIFKSAGGQVEGRVNCDFVDYVDRIFEDVGLPSDGVPKAVRDFISECAWVTD